MNASEKPTESPRYSSDKLGYAPYICSRVQEHNKASAGKNFSRLIVALSVALASACLLSLSFLPSSKIGGDAWAYAAYAQGFREHGFLSDIGNVRTYGYPTFLYLLTYLTPSSQSVWLLAGIVQYGLLLVATIWLSTLVRKYDPSFANAVLVGLLLNPFIISLVVDSFTEGLLAPVIVLLIALTIALGKAMRRTHILVWLMAGALLSFFAPMIRPAAMLVPLAWIVASVAALSRAALFTQGLPQRHEKRLSRRSERTRILLINVGLLIAGSIVAWAPQIYYNYVAWGTPSPLPICRLDELQLAASISVLRYESIVLANHADPYFYLNPFSTTDLVLGHPINWYVGHPLAGIKTVLLRLVAGLSINHLFTLTYNDRSVLGLILLAAYWILMSLGVIRIAVLSIGALGGEIAPPACLQAAIVFIGICAVGVLALNSFTSVELRFNLVPIGVLCVFGVDALLRPMRGPFGKRSFLLGVIVGLALAVGSALFLSLYASAGPIRNAPKVSLHSSECYTFRSEAISLRYTKPPIE